MCADCKIKPAVGKGLYCLKCRKKRQRAWKGCGVTPQNPNNILPDKFYFPTWSRP